MVDEGTMQLNYAEDTNRSGKNTPQQVGATPLVTSLVESYFVLKKCQNRSHRACMGQFCSRQKGATLPKQFLRDALQNVPQAPKWSSDPITRTSSNYCARFLAVAS
jgi:hypothetical protein